MSEKHSHKYFRNADCEYFPCHEVEDDSYFNCMFCFCPLYFLEDCGGTPRYTNEGVKDCTPCTRPHARGGYERIVERLKAELAERRKQGSQGTGF